MVETNNTVVVEEADLVVIFLNLKTGRTVENMLKNRFKKWHKVDASLVECSPSS